MSSVWNDFWGAVIVTVVGAASWLVRRVITNQRLIEMAMAEIKHRDQLREADRADIADVKKDVREIRNAIIGKGR